MVQMSLELSWLGCFSVLGLIGQKQPLQLHCDIYIYIYIYIGILPPYMPLINFPMRNFRVALGGIFLLVPVAKALHF